MADRKVNIELNITASAQQAQQVLGGLFGRGAGGGIGAGIFAGGPGGAIAAGAVMAAVALKDFAANLTSTSYSLSKLANPAQAVLFDLAMNDLLAVVGDRLTPVLEFATEGVRMLGDFLESVLPSSAQLRAVMAPLKDIMAHFKDALVAVVPVIKDVLLWGLVQVGKGLAWMAGFLQGLFGPSRGLQFPASSFGKAARPAQQFGDVNSAIEAMNLQALSGASVQDQQLEVQQQMARWVQEINQMMKAAQASGAAAGAAATMPLVHGAQLAQNFWLGWTLAGF